MTRDHCSGQRSNICDVKPLDETSRHFQPCNKTGYFWRHIRYLLLGRVAAGPETTARDTCCVSVQGLHPSEEHLKANYVTTRHKVCLKAPPSAPSFPSFWRMHSYYPSWPHISPRLFVCPEKNKEREKMVTSCGTDRHFRWPGRQKSWRKSKTSGDATRKCSKGETVTFNNSWRG